MVDKELLKDVDSEFGEEHKEVAKRILQIYRSSDLTIEGVIHNLVSLSASIMRSLKIDQYTIKQNGVVRVALVVDKKWGWELKKYKCHKEVHATPMSRGEYNQYKGWDIPKDENPLDPGYLVVYSKDTPDHYESWSPKKQFEEGCTEIDW